MKIHLTYFGSTSRTLIAILLAAAVGAASVQPAFATRKSQAQEAKKEAQSNLNSVNSDISSITAKQRELQSEINELDAELVDLLVNMDILSDELDDKKLEIKQANKDLKVAKEEEADQYERMKQRIRYMYERGNSSILEALFGASSMSDFLNKVNYCNEVYDYDREQLEEYKEIKRQVIALKDTLETEESEMEEMQDNYEVQEKELKTMVTKKEATMDDFDSQLSQAKVLAAAYKTTIQQQNEIIRDEEEKERLAAEAARQEAARQEAARQAAQQEAVRQEAARQEAMRQQSAQAHVASYGTQSSGTGSAASNNGGSASSGGSSAPSNEGSSTTSNGSSSVSSGDNVAIVNEGSSSTDSGSSASSDENIPVVDSAQEENNSAPVANASGTTGSDVIAYARQFIGNPYVWGGTSLTHGADCSGFVMSVYAHFGYSLPHSSAAMRSCGRGVSYSEAQPGDLICYSGHVALYAGGGMIVGAQSSRTGITTQTATYRTILAVRRIIN